MKLSQTVYTWLCINKVLTLKYKKRTRAEPSLLEVHPVAWNRFTENGEEVDADIALPGFFLSL